MEETVLVGSRFFSSEPYLITIGDHVQITDNVRFFTHGGGWVLRSEMPDLDTFGKIKIQNNVYIGSGSLIMPGVIIGNNVIIGAGFVVTKSILSNVVVAGNPAKIIGSYEQYREKTLLKNVHSKMMTSVEKRKYLLSLPDEDFIVKDYMR
ncbi:MAG: acyltransferase [Bacteroidales bacterium]|nr:acyltransferase [Bacteroidales bacterium]